MKIKKVYCENCKYFVDYSDLYTKFNKWCTKIIDSKLRITPCTQETPSNVYLDYIYINDYKKQNKYNNCKYYKRKWYKLWIK